MWDRKEKITINKDKLLYILDFFDVYLMQFIQEILMDSKEDPHFSAVAANNMILCYLEIMTDVRNYHTTVLKSISNFKGLIQRNTMHLKDPE